MNTIKTTYNSSNYQITYSDFCAYSFNAKEKDYESGFHYYGSRYYSSELNIWNSTDPMADKYPSLTPYNYCANNPVKLIDPNGEEIVTNAPDNYEGNIKVSKSLSEKTGLKLSFKDKKLTYEKDEYGNAIINGGSESARKDLITAIDDEDFTYEITYREHSNSINGGKSTQKKTNQEYNYMVLDIADFKESDPRSFDIGMVFLHELQHGYFGLTDPDKRDYTIYSPDNSYKGGLLGNVVERVNVYRKELGYPLRRAYNANPYNNSIPFSDGSWIKLNYGGIR